MKIAYLLLTFSLFTLLLACEKEEKLPSLTTTEIISITDTSAIVKGKINEDGSSKIINSGVAWSTNINPTKKDDYIMDTTNGNTISVQLSNLTPSTTYYVKAFSENKVGVSYGNELSFSTNFTLTSKFGDGVTDIDGNIYKTIVLGNSQEWMSENLRTTTCADGTPIPNVENKNDWKTQSTPAWANYQNDIDYNEPYGKLYNWYAVNQCDVCPNGWRVPSKEDWNDLQNYLGSDAGGKMKDKGTEFWKPYNNGATNESKFSSIPGGLRHSDGAFNIKFHTYAYYWSTTEDPQSNLGALGVFNSYISIGLNGSGFFKMNGLNIRCIKN